MNEKALMSPSDEAPSKQLRASRTQWVHDTIAQQISQGILAGGSRIREGHIAKTLQVSRTPVREAIAKLMAVGMLQKTKDGLVVAKLTEVEVGELFALREILEGSAARFAARHAGSVAVAKMRIICKKFEEAKGDRARIFSLNQDFHQTIHECALNKYLLRTLDEINILRALMPRPTFDTDGRFEVSIVEHKRILDAIAAGDADAAEAEARQHVRSAHRARIEKMFD